MLTLFFVNLQKEMKPKQYIVFFVTTMLPSWKLDSIHVPPNFSFIIMTWFCDTEIKILKVPQWNELMTLSLTLLAPVSRLQEIIFFVLLLNYIFLVETSVKLE